MEQCESVESAIVREVKEESGLDIAVASVRLLGSQPWPIGRGGTCELMLAAVARATDPGQALMCEEMAEIKASPPRVRPVRPARPY